MTALRRVSSLADTSTGNTVGDNRVLNRAVRHTSRCGASRSSKVRVSLHAVAYGSIMGIEREPSEEEGQMSHRCLAVVFTVIGVVALTPMFAAAQSAELPRTPWGAPDLQGVWDFRTLTPLERPEALADKAFLSEEEAAAFRAGNPVRPRCRPPRRRGNPGRYRERRRGGHTTSSGGTTAPTSPRTGGTSLIVDPPDGRIPWTPEQQESMAELFAQYFSRVPEGPEDRGFVRAVHPRLQLRPARCCRAPTTTTCSCFRRRTMSSSSTRWSIALASCRWLTSRLWRPASGSGGATPEAAGRTGRWSSRPLTFWAPRASSVPASTCASSSA